MAADTGRYRLTMTTPQKQTIGWALGVLVAVLIFLHVRSDAHKETAAEAAQKAEQRSAAHWKAVADTAAGKLRVDTVRFFQNVTHSDTVLTRIVDTAIVHHHDTVSVPVTVLVQADSAIRVCRVTVSDCMAYGVAQKARGDSLDAALGNANKAKPDFFQRHLALTFGYGAVANGGKVLTGPAVSLGWKLWPPNP